MKVEYIPNADYSAIYHRQLEEFNHRVECRKKGLELPEDLILAVEHTPVFTLGKHGDAKNMLVSEKFLKERGIEIFRIERGGDITYHGPGQLTLYPIIDLQRYHLGVKDYVNILEEAVIETLKSFNIKGERVEGATGVWLEKGTGKERKISAIGIKCSRHVTMHGLALNVGEDLTNFSLINPCGFIDKGVTSISLETGENVDVKEVADMLTENLTRLLLLRIPSQETS